MVLHTPSPVLLIEDDLEDAFLIRQSMKRFQSKIDLHQVRTLGEAKAYLTKADSSADISDDDTVTVPSCIVLDLKLPDGNGLSLLEWITEQNTLSDVPVIVLTSEPKMIEDEAQRAGVSLIMEKPRALDGYRRISETLASLLIAAGGIVRPSNDNDLSSRTKKGG